jgi:hypothetical protein
VKIIWSVSQEVKQINAELSTDLQSNSEGFFDILSLMSYLANSIDQTVLRSKVIPCACQFFATYWINRLDDYNLHFAQDILRKWNF